MGKKNSSSSLFHLIQYIEGITKWTQNQNILKDALKNHSLFVDFHNNVFYYYISIDYIP